MPLYRAYPRPDNPTVYGELKLEAHDDDVKYTPQLKTACLAAAGPQPNPPRYCPRCGQAATFDTRPCYKYGIAGAWNMVCRLCTKVHIPTQVGPSEEDLEHIESIRAQDRAAQLAHEDKKARVRDIKKAAKEKKARERVAKVSGNPKPLAREDDPLKPQKEGPHRTKSNDAALRDEKQRPFSMISNALPLPAAYPKRGREPATLRREPATLRREPATRAQNVPDAINVADESVDPSVRIIVLVLWEKADHDPYIERVAVPLGDAIFLYHYPRVRAIPAPTEFERWVIGSNLWNSVPWEISPIEVHPEDDVIFVRVMGIRCRGFGRHLHDYQLEHGHALTPELSIGRAIHDPPHRYWWILVWSKNHTRPDIYFFNFALLDDESEDDPVPRPWLDSLEETMFYLIWHEMHTRWEGVVHGNDPSIPNGAPIVLLAHPGVETLQGSGEAIAWLESWRARIKDNSRDSTPTESSRAQPMRAAADDASRSPPPQRGTSKRARESSPDAPHHRAREANKIPRTSLEPSLRRRARNARDPVDKDVTMVDVDHSRDPSKPPSGTQANPLTIVDDDDAVQVLRTTPRKPSTCGRSLLSDDEPEFVEGSSRTPLKAKIHKPHKAPELDGNGDEIIDLTDL